MGADLRASMLFDARFVSGPGAIIEELVHQFSDPFAFYRELIQNSIDAGSSRIEVELSFRPGGKDGVLQVCVSDWGEGMTRDVIENYLVTKFRSTKENDLTKIGKFGIGFVSLFACKPDAVTVDTGRDGEFWRVLFRADTSWELLKVPGPLEGTRITLHKALPARDYADFVARSRASLGKWCKHSDVEVTFCAGGVEGSPPHAPLAVREPLTLDAPFFVEHREEGTHILAGPARTEPPFTGLYNRGLTLLETTEALLPGVTLKIASRYLEHTLTRDNVRRDNHFAKAMALARTLVEDHLIPRLADELKAAATRKDGADDFATLFTFARPRLKPKHLWYRLVGGGAASHQAVLDHHARAVVAATAPSPVVDRLLAAGVPVLEWSPGTALAHEVLRSLKREQVLLAEVHFSYAAPPDVPTPPEFASTLSALLADAGARRLQVEVSDVRGAAASEVFVVLDALGAPVNVETALGSVFTRTGPALLCFNLGHAAVAAAVPLFARAPRLSAVLLARLVLVRAGKLDAARDEALTRWALT